MASSSDRTQSAQSNDQSSQGIERISRLTVNGVQYEAIVASQGESLLRVSCEDLVKSQQLEDDDIDNLVQFFNSYQREQRRALSQMKRSSSTDNRGQVLHPETDGRLKGNEANRPNDPDRSKQAEGGRRGGQN